MLECSPGNTKWASMAATATAGGRAAVASTLRSTFDQQDIPICSEKVGEEENECVALKGPLMSGLLVT